MSGSEAGLLRRGFEVLFPPACLVCGESLAPGAEPLCPLCRHRLPSVPPPRCPRCGATRRLALPGADGCTECLDWDPVLPRAAAPHLMEGGAARLVRGLKYGGWRAAAGPMGRSMACAARDVTGGRRATLVPVPLSPARLRERGFNQAALLAVALGDALGWPCRRLLARRPGGARQARLGRRRRAANVRGRFVAREGGGPPALLVDDVITTGATATACARALRDAGHPVVGAVAYVRSLQSLAADPQHRIGSAPTPAAR